MEELEASWKGGSNALKTIILAVVMPTPIMAYVVVGRVRGGGVRRGRVVLTTHYDVLTTDSREKDLPKQEQHFG